jgi:endonuclease/exonuclease/phosphatase (EEP) superfamily protein YafD
MPTSRVGHTEVLPLPSTGLHPREESDPGPALDKGPGIGPGAGESGEVRPVSPGAARGGTGRSFLRRIPAALGILALVHPLAKLLARWDWRADLLTHLQEPALVVTLLAIVALARRHRRVTIALAALAALQVGSMIRFDGPKSAVPVPRPGGPRLRILISNVLMNNEDYDRLIGLIRLEQPDVIGLVEVTEEWVAATAPLNGDYPYRVDYPAGARGMSLLFRRPPLSIDPPRLPIPAGNPALHATFDFAGGVRHLWLVHPPNPLSRRGRGQGKPEIEGLARLIVAGGGSTIVVGDLNRTGASPLFGDFLRATGLRDSRRGFGRQPTWPNESFYRIAIDHAFVSDDLAVVDRRIGPDIGSDHFPLIVDLAPASARNSPSQASHWDH